MSFNFCLSRTKSCLFVQSKQLSLAKGSSTGAGGRNLPSTCSSSYHFFPSAQLSWCIHSLTVLPILMISGMKNLAVSFIYMRIGNTVCIDMDMGCSLLQKLSESYLSLSTPNGIGVEQDLILRTACVGQDAVLELSLCE